MGTITSMYINDNNCQYYKLNRLNKNAHKKANQLFPQANTYDAYKVPNNKIGLHDDETMIKSASSGCAKSRLYV